MWGEHDYHKVGASSSIFCGLARLLGCLPDWLVVWAADWQDDWLAILVDGWLIGPLAVWALLELFWRATTCETLHGRVRPHIDTLTINVGNTCRPTERLRPTADGLLTGG